MAHEVYTNFPSSVDERIFYNDLDLNGVETLNKYKKLLDASDYDGASILLNESDVDYFGAWLLNTLELRIRAIQEHLLTKEKPTLQVYSSTTPTDLKKNLVWVGGDENFE